MNEADEPRSGDNGESRFEPAVPAIPAGPGPGAARNRVEASLLGHLIREARATARSLWGRTWTLDLVAERAGLRRPALVAIERGDRLPSVAALARLHDLLPGTDGQPRTTEDLALWLARWARAQVGRAAGDDRSPRFEPALRAQLLAAAEMVDSAVTPPTPPDPASPRSLVDFPGRFPGVVALVGDRRELPPRSRGDLFVAPAAITDVSFLTALPTGTIASIRSDKLVAVGDQAAERELGGYDVLIIAGPNVNWAVRRANRGALFRYDVAPVWERWEGDYRAELHLGSPGLLAAFAALVGAVSSTTHELDLDRARRSFTASEAANLGDARRVLDRLLARTAERPGPGGETGGYFTAAEVIGFFSGVGHADPVAGAVHGQGDTALIDHAVISLAPSPFDAGRVAVLVGGAHGPGTAHAVRYLVDHPEQFTGRPYGGVLEIRMGEYVDWSSRFQQPATLRWLTPEYSPGQLRATFEAAADPASRRSNPALADRTTAQIEAAIAFVDRLAAGPGRHEGS